jgi:hypothetical protein
MTTLSEFKAQSVESRMLTLLCEGSFKRHAITAERKKRSVTVSEDKKDLNTFNTSMNKLKVDFVTPQDERKRLYDDYVKTITATKETIKSKAATHDTYIKERVAALKVINSLADDAVVEYKGLKSVDSLEENGDIDAWMVKAPKSK